MLSTAVAKVIDKNITGLRNIPEYKEFVEEILSAKSYEGIAKTRYVNDKQITDHYAIVPTGQGFNNLKNLSATTKAVYYAIVRRFLSIFYPAAVYKKISISLRCDTESFLPHLKFLKRRLSESCKQLQKIQGRWRRNRGRKV